MERHGVALRFPWRPDGSCLLLVRKWSGHADDLKGPTNPAVLRERRWLTRCGGLGPAGKKLVCCGSDDRHTLHVWDWRKKQLLAELPGQNGAPPQVYGVQWNPFNPSQLVSYGINHLKGSAPARSPSVRPVSLLSRCVVFVASSDTSAV